MAYLTLTQASLLLVVSKRTVKDLSRRPKNPLPLIRLGHRTYRVDEAALRAWMAREQAGEIEGSDGDGSTGNSLKSDGSVNS
jgi:excisionase family DNA binding protein